MKELKIVEFTGELGGVGDLRLFVAGWELNLVEPCYSDIRLIIYVYGFFFYKLISDFAKLIETGWEGIRLR